MDPSSFLDRPENSVHILSWNINAVKTKLEKDNIYSMIKEYDVISLNEVKTPLKVSCPGYIRLTSRDMSNPGRGGTCVLIKNQLVSQLSGVDLSKPDQVWLQLRCFPSILFGFIYVPPQDSPYYSEASFSNIQEKIKTEKSVKEYVIVGDINARLGKKLRELPENIDRDDLSYPTIPDSIQTPNGNANIIFSICCEENLAVVNNAKIKNEHFKSKLTYKQGSNWTSELDLCLMSPNMLNRITKFNIIHDFSLPSDHAPLTFALQQNLCLDKLLEHATFLGDHAVLYQRNKRNVCKNPIKYSHVDPTSFLDKLFQCDLPNEDIELEPIVMNLSKTLYECAADSRTSIQAPQADLTLSRWERLLEGNSDKQVWAAINWHGELNVSNPLESAGPTDEQFKEFFDQALNSDEPSSLDQISSDIYVPVLDDPITELEVKEQVSKLKSDKAAGTDGIPPGILKLLPPTWIVFITILLNKLFVSSIYPQSWAIAKLFTIFKKGDKHLPSNYRGITIINCLAKVFDMILCERLQLWFRPYREQAGSERGRGCLEHIATLRLISDYAVKKKIKLYIVFVDFSQAYDKVSRVVLFTILKRLGCGATMLMALIAMYKMTQSIIGTALITASIGVRQGSPTSCLLFVLFVNDLIKMFKERYGPDGFLAWLHVLVFMDDTVILSTSQNGILAKLGLLNEFCISYGMKVNVSKTKFMVINGTAEDKNDLIVQNMIVKVCKYYVYLGSPFSSDGLNSSSIKINANLKMCQALKFVSFCLKNNDIPFYVKKKVFHAAVMSSILYGCESWLNGNIKPMEKVYNMCIKHLLGVRKNTTNTLCLIELGLPPLKALVAQRQRHFFKKMWAERGNMIDDPFRYAIFLTKNSNNSTSRYLNDLIDNDFDDIGQAMNSLYQEVNNSQKSKCTYYKEINPNMDVHNIYMLKSTVNELERISWTKLRLSAHSLAIETGRWNRRGRGILPREQRLCQCGLIQTEQHVIEECSLSQHVRQMYNLTSLVDLMSEREDYQEACHIVHTILDIYK